MKHLFIPFIISVLCCSCGTTYQCPKENLLPAFIGYAVTEVDTLLLERYKKGTNFTQRIDTSFFNYYNSSFTRSGDTTILYALKPEGRFNDEYDFRIINPFDNKVITVTDMKFRMEEGHSGGLFGSDPSPCFSPLLSYVRDNVALIIINPGRENQYLFIRK